jgi:hypothetical protein
MDRRAVLQLRESILLLLFLMTLAGCAPVAGNYPDQRASKSSLPDEFKSPQGTETQLAWVVPGRVHGFVNFWRDTSVRADFFRKIAAQSNLEVHREGARQFDALSEAGIAEITMFAFFGKNVELAVKKGDFEVTFDDGTVVRDVGVLRSEPRDTKKPYRSTRAGPTKLSSEPVGDPEKPLGMAIFVPAEYLDKKVASVRFTGEI